MGQCWSLTSAVDESTDSTSHAAVPDATRANRNRRTTLASAEATECDNPSTPAELDAAATACDGETVGFAIPGGPPQRGPGLAGCPGHTCEEHELLERFSCRA